MAKSDDKAAEPANELCKKINTWITETYDSKENKTWRDRIKDNRKYNSGKDLHDDGETGLVRANLIYSTIQTLLPRIYAKNPELAISPVETLQEKRADWIKPFCQTLTIVLNRYLEDADLKRRGKSSARSAMVIALAWLKIGYQKDIRTDQEMFNRIADTQDNIQRIEHLISEIEEGDDSYEDLEAQQLELDQQLRALEEEAEVVVSEGLVIDRIKPEDILVDGDIDDPDAYVQADRIAHRVWKTREKYEQDFKKEPGDEADRWSKDSNALLKDGEKSDTSDKYAVWEVWDKVSQTVYTLCQGDDNWSREPYTPELIGARFYPFFMLFFNPVDGEFFPMSDVELLKEVADEYNSTRTQLSEHRKLNKPKFIADSATDTKSLQRYEDSELGEIILVDANGRPLNEVIQPARTNPINPAVYDTTAIRTDFEFLSGAGDAGRGAVQTAKTATEASILSETLSSRTSERQDVLEDFVREIAIYSSQILLLEIDEAKVATIAGEQSVWPKMEREQIFNIVQIEVRAGTSGKPNRVQEQKTWLEFLPQLRDNVIQTSELRGQGRDEEADALIAITKETFRRFDERIDIEEFIPSKDEEDPQVALAKAMQKIKQMEAMLMQAQQQMQEFQQQANAEIDKARNENSRDVGKKLFELEKLKLSQYDVLNEKMMELQQNYQAGVTNVMSLLAEYQQKSEPNEQNSNGSQPSVINLNIDAKSGEVAKTIDVTGWNENGVKQMVVTPHEVEEKNV